MSKVLAAATAAFLFLTSMSALAAQSSQTALKHMYIDLDELCRGGSGDDPATERACDQRNVVSAQLRKLNICIVSVGDGFGDCSNAPSDIDNVINVTKAKNQFGLWDLKITVRADELAINRIVVNRNNCPIQSVSQTIGGSMKFGEQIDLMTLCEPIEVSVDTDQGHSVVGWDKSVDPAFENTAAPVDQQDYVDAFSARKYEYGAWHIVLTLRVDKATITGVTVNRGNCRVYNPSEGSDRKMRFGETFDMAVTCDPISLSIQTDTGSQVLTWDE